MSGKILEYGARNRKCKRCDLGHPQDDHPCHRNFQGSAKAMEADVGADLINNSKILKEANLNVRVVIGDDDSSTIAAVRRGNSKEIYKLRDRNHLTKSFSKELYKLQGKFKEMDKKATITHLKKCFRYALAQNNGKSKELASTLRSIPDHFFNHHANCGSWYHHHDNIDSNKKQTVILKDRSLHEQLSRIFDKYANNSHKFCIPASSQANEAVNNMIAHKMPKNMCHSRSESANFRRASAVCTKNDGESHFQYVEKSLSLSPGIHTAAFARTLDNVRSKRARKSKLSSTKRRRQCLLQEKENLRKKNENTEGIKYQSNCGLVDNDEELFNFYESQISNIPGIAASFDSCNSVYFDLETSGFKKTDKILQIAAKCEDRTFTVYATPTKAINSDASEHTGLKYIAGELYLRDLKLITLPLKDCLDAFSQFLNLSAKPCLLVAHNATFDTSHLLRAILQYSMTLSFVNVAGFADTLKLFRKQFSGRQDPGQFKLGQ